MPEVGRLAAGADILITVLPGPGEVRELMLGTGGAAAALRPGTTWIDMTSNSPAAATEIRLALLDRGVQVLDAPAGGGVAAAAVAQPARATLRPARVLVAAVRAGQHRRGDTRHLFRENAYPAGRGDPAAGAG